MAENPKISEATKLAVMKEMASRGGKAKVTKGIGTLSEKERREIAMKGVAARRKKASAAKTTGKKASRKAESK
jgi:hypothetical protein